MYTKSFSSPKSSWAYLTCYSCKMEEIYIILIKIIINFITIIASIILEMQGGGLQFDFTVLTEEILIIIWNRRKCEMFT